MILDGKGIMSNEDVDSDTENIEDLEDEDDDETRTYDLGMLGKALIIFGFIIMLTYFIFLISASISSLEGTWEGSYVGNVNAFACALPLSILLIIAGFALYFLDSGIESPEENSDLDEFGDDLIPVDENSVEPPEK
jgi:hypothetical protein